MKRKLSLCLTAMAVSTSLLAGCASGTASSASASSAAAASSMSVEEASAVSASSALKENTIYYTNPSLKENLPDEKPSAGEDFYLSVNYDFIKDTEIPDGLTGIGQDGVMDESVEKEMEDLLSGDNTGNEKAEKLSILYQKYLDTESRNATGWDSVKPYIEAVEQAETADDLIHMIDADVAHWSLYNLFGLEVIPSEEDSSQMFIVLATPELKLGDPSEYSEMTDDGKAQKEIYDDYDTNLLKKYGYSDDEIQTMLADSYSWEEKNAQYIFSTKGLSPMEILDKENNVLTREEVIALAGDFPMEELLKNLGADDKESYMVGKPDYFKALATLVTDENLPEMKAYLILHVLETASQYTDEEAYGYYADFQNAQYGTTSGIISVEEQAYDFVDGLLSELTGDVYADAFFDETTKEDVQGILDNVKAALRSRLENNTWLSDETKEKALEKLDAIQMDIGCASVDRYDYAAVTPDASQDLFSNYLLVSSQIEAQDYALAGTPRNKDAWGAEMAANTVNALYDAQSNHVHIPAAALQEPLYSKDYTDEQNYGGIGIIVGHELTHAFDSQGSLFDKDGNEVNWWTDEDSATFAELTGKVSERYGSYCIDGEYVDGDKTVTETVADLGGAACALDALKALHADDQDQIDYAEFFTKNATYWGVVYASPEAIAYLMQNDNHAPSCLRVNVNLTQFDEFYDAFGVKEGDAMYTAPEDRLQVW